MTINEANKILKELSKDVRPEELNEKTLRLFNAIMKIADERDLLKSENATLKQELNTQRKYYQNRLMKLQEKLIRLQESIQEK